MMETSLDNKLVSLGITNEAWTKALNCEENVTMIRNKNGELYWLKKTSPARGVWRYKALNLVSRLMNLPLLKAVPQHGGKEAITTEARRITSLTAIGIIVPKLIWQSSDFLLLSHIGHSVVIKFKDKNTSMAEKRLLLTACLSAIKEIHIKNQHLSQAFVRNMTQVNEDPVRIGFIDFEDDPKTVMSVAEAQARDLLLFVDSVARFFLTDQAFFNQAITQFLHNHDAHVIQLLRHTTQKLQWVTKLPFQKALGHDFEKLKLGLLSLKGV